MKILVIDNYDSFTYNLVHAIKKITGLPVDVYRNDEIELDEIEKYNKIVLSPGPEYESWEPANGNCIHTQLCSHQCLSPL